MATLNLTDLVKNAREAGLSPSDINVLVEKEEKRYQSEIEREEKRLEREREEKRLELEREEKRLEREERLHERERKKLADAAKEADKQREEAEKQREEAERQRAHELALAQIKVASTDNDDKGDSKGGVSFPKLRMPNFQDGKDEIDDYLKMFERIAELQGWAKEKKHIYLGSLLSGKALKVYVSLPDNIVSDYSQLKESLLKAYNVDAESYRRKFRESKAGDNETFVQLTARMSQYLNNWLVLSDVQKEYDDLFEFMIKDQLLCNCSAELRIFLKERNFDSILDMAQAADRFRSAHKYVRSRKTASNAPHVDKDATKSDNDNSTTPSKKTVVCHHCNETGHIRPNCPDLKSSNSKGPQISKEMHKVNFVLDREISPPGTTTCPGHLFNHPVTVTLDSGCNTVIVKESLLPSQYKRGRKVTLYDYLGIGTSFNMVRCFIKCKFFRGWVDAIAAPLKFADILLGTVPGVKIPWLPTDDRKDELMSEQPVQPSEIPSCNEVVQNVMTRAGTLRDAKAPTPLIVPKLTFDDITKQNLIDGQSNCSTLAIIRNQVKNEAIVTVKNRSVRYEMVNDLIYRVCLQSKNEHEVGMKQLVVPMIFRNIILATAHDSSVAGHFSHRKTSEKIFHKFFWPGAGADIKRYCKSCHVCQKSTPKGKIKKAPLVSMPIISVPFSRVAIDLVGPLTPSKRGHKYILTLIDLATRFPEAIPLKHIDTVTIAESLVNIFSRVGIPKEILSDRGTQFRSDLMNEIHRLLSIKAIFTSPYHACCNGTVERFHAVLKPMLKKLCVEQPQDWDRYIPSVLFAYREVPNDTLKFSPFELLYGRKVRGPLSVLHDLWTNNDIDDEVKCTYQYVLDLRTRLEESAQLASLHANVNSKLYKMYFDKNSKTRSLKEGDEVLVLLPTTNNKLLMQWKGPYSVVRRHDNGVDYLIKVNNKIKIYHINMLKKYIRRDDTNTKICQICIIDTPEESPDTCDISVFSDGNGLGINVNPELSKQQTKELNELNARFSDVFSDKPGTTRTVIHDIKLTTDVPVHRKPYPVPHNLVKVFEEEVDKMLDLGVIEPSDSPYCSATVLVKKPDNSWRFCSDFRPLNDVSLFDAEPMPTMDESLGDFVGDVYFSEIDLCKGYWQIPLSDRSKPYTAFATSRGLMQYVKMPFGLKTACATFVRLMRKVTRGLTNTACYFDNLVVHNSSWEDHLSDLESLYQRLRSHGLTAGPSKCFLAYPTIKYLGFSLGNNSLSPLPNKIKAIVDMPLPQTKKQLRSFIGTVSFYRKFISNFADILSPVNILLKKFSSNKLEWTNEQIKRIQILKDKLVQSPILTLPDYSKVFYLRTDASDTGLGAVLLQRVDDTLMPIAYASRNLQDRERRYSVIDRECLSIVWAINKFNNYLYGREFVLQTDQQPLTYLRNMKNGNSRLMRWSLALQSYSFTIEYIKGENNVGADLLSRCSL